MRTDSSWSVAAQTALFFRERATGAYAPHGQTMGDFENALGAVGFALGAAGCCSVPSGSLSGRWVLVARGPSAAGVASSPRYAAPLAVTSAAGGSCFSSATLDGHFGAQCADHESEGGAASTMTDEVPLGPTPTPAEVRWYCDRHTVLRVLLLRCGATDTFSVSEVAVARTEN